MYSKLVGRKPTVQLTDLRRDICEAYNLFEVHYNKGGWLRERPSNRRRMMATNTQLHRMGFVLGNFARDWMLTERGWEIYRALEQNFWNNRNQEREQAIVQENKNV